MITDLWIENFKGIGKRQHIPLRPITLLFGANSAGKSTVLHALLYLREIVCNQNVNPTKPLEGNQTVNLGGFHNLIHKPAGDSIDDAADLILVLGCKLTGSSGPFAPNMNIATQYEFFSNETACYGHRWLDPDIGDSYVVGSPDHSELFGESSGGCDPDAEIYVTIQGRASLDFRLLVAGEELLSIHSGCWINIWHPLATGSPVSQHNQVVLKKIERLKERLGKAFSSRQWIPLDIHPWETSGIIHSSSVLTVPTSPRTFVRDRRWAELFHSESWRRGPVFTLASFLGSLECNDEFLNQMQKVNLDRAFVVFELNLPEDTQKFPYNITVGVRSDSQCRLEVAVELVRLACLMEATAGWFSLDCDPNGFPTFRSPSLRCSDVGNGLVGMSLLGPSLDQHDAFDRCRARIDQQLRTSLTQLDSDLRELCYVGPKRSTVPRNLNSDVMDEFSSWGDGLGAWRWMLKCTPEELEHCSSWLNEKSIGLGTGFVIEHERIFEIPESLVQNMPDGYDLRDAIEHYSEAVDHDHTYRDWMSKRNYQRICLRDSITGNRRHPQDVGEGITQVVPVIAAFVRASNTIGAIGLLAIEQPELHLHPSLAAKIGDLALSMMPARQSPSMALIETHSEHLILRILRRIRQTTDNELPEHIPPVKPDDVCVLWVDNLGDGTTIQRLRIDERGEFIDRWPKGFFSERAEELY